MTTQLFYNDWVRRLSLAAALYGWLLILNMSASAYNGMPLCFFLSGYLFWVACKCWMRWIVDGRSHSSFWLWFGALLLISVVITASNFGAGSFLTFIGAWMCDRFTADMGGNDIHLRGGKIVSLKQAEQHYNKIRPDKDAGILLGGAQIPTREATTHFAICGTVGSGKTVTIQLMMKDTISRIGKDGRRALLYDPKIEFYPVLEGLGIHPEDIVLMNPFDARCRPWHMAKDIVTATDAETLAHILVPEKDKSNDEFWRNATIIAIKAVVRYLSRSAPERWTFRDLLLALRSRDIILKMMRDDSRLHHYAQTFGTEKTADNIMATVLTSIERYEPIAALWHKVETLYHRKPYSLTEWSTGSKVILLGKSETAVIQMRELNRILITRAAQLLLEKPETPLPDSFLIFDELASLGNMTPLIDLAEQGRSKGVSLIVGFQSKKHLDKNFDENLSTAFLGQFNHIAALRINEEETAKWIAGIIGRKYGVRFTGSVSTSWGNPDQYSEQEQYYDEFVVDPSELQAIPAFRPDQGQGLKGLYKGHVNWWATYDPSIVKYLPSRSTSRTFDPLPKHFQELEDWTDEDYQRLGMRHFSPDVQNIDLEEYLNEPER
jgi:hypothetical protein